MPRPAYILVHPGSLAAHGGGPALDEAIRELEHHDGPLIVIDGFLSDKTAPYDDRLRTAFEATEAKGEFAIRMWGCDAGERPFNGWQGYASPGVAIDLVHSDQQQAAQFLAPILRSRDAILSGAWATYDGSSGCVNSVGQSLLRARWPGSYSLSGTALFEEESEDF